MLDTEATCVRRVISHIELENFIEPAFLVLNHMNEMASMLHPLTELRTVIRKVTFNGEPYTLIEVNA